MKKEEFHSYRQKLAKTQKQMAELLGTSLKAVQSFEQGWRKVPVHVERQIFFLWVMKKRNHEKARLCWDIRRCPQDRRVICPAWEFNSGHLCWFINGTICEGKALKSWAKKMNICRKCEIFALRMK